MKGIYISQDLTHAYGIFEKINQQIHEFEKNNCQITRHINKKRTMFDLIKNLVPFFSEQYFQTNQIDWSLYDFAYIRKGAVLDKSVVQMLKKAKTINPQITIILEIPTYPYLNEFKGLVKLDIRLKEKKWVKQLKKYVDRIVTYSDDPTIFGVQCLNISNAYEFTPLKKNLQQTNDGSTIRLLGVATLCFYHGYDRIIEGLKNYYDGHSQREKVTFTLVGDGPVLQKYQQLVNKYRLNEVVFLEGRKNFTELDEYYQQADIGVDSLARHRSGVTYNSSLKGKEYLAKGLPIISGVRTDLDQRNLSFYYRVPNNDCPVVIDEIVQWYQQLIKQEDRAQLSEKIYAYGKQQFNFATTFFPVINYVKGASDE